MTTTISPEELKTPEIESPEELIKKLEENSKKTLAEKVKSVLAGINGTTEEKWQKLKAELSTDEEKEIRETLKDKETKIETVLSEGITPTNLTDAKAIAGTLATKEGMDKVIKEGKNGMIGEVKNLFSSLFAFLGNLPFIGGFFAAIGKMFGFGVKAEEAAQAVSEIATSPETKAKIQKESKAILGNPALHIKPETIDKTINNISEKDLKTLEEKLKTNGKITLSDLKELDSFKGVLSKEAVKQNVEAYKKELFINLKKEIENKYNIKLTEEQGNKLKGLIQSELKISDATLETLTKSIENKNVKFKDIYGSMQESGVNTSSFFIKLITSGIIPISALGLDFVKTGGQILSSSIDLVAGGLGIQEKITMDTFLKTTEELSQEEKAILIALVYRKGGLFLSLIGNLGAYISRLGIESVTNTNVKSWDLMKNSITGNAKAQADNFSRISQALEGHSSRNTEGNKILKEACDNIEHVRKNYLTIEILRESAGNFNKACNSLKAHGIDIPNGVNNFEELRTKIGNNFKISFNETLSKTGAYNKFGFGANADLYELNKKLDNIVRSQQKTLSGSLLKNPFKLLEAGEASKISRLGDRLAFHFTGPQEAKEFAKKMGTMFQYSPDLIKTIFDKLPIFVVAGIAANSDKGFFEEFSKEFKYLIPVLGPILLLGDAGIDWNNGIKVDNALEAGIGGALLTIDGIFLTKELATNGASGVGRYLAKPITDIYSIGKGTAHMGYNAYKVAEASKGKELFKNALEKTRYIKGVPRLAALAALVAAGGVAYAYSDNDTKEYLEKDGSINTEKLRKDASKMSTDEKEELIKVLFQIEMGENLTKNLDFSIKESKLVIDSRNKSVQSNFLINDNIAEKLSILGINGFKFNYYGQS